ncbi:hypothetical protein Clacol_001531 [Clathrus columnatus]|uniref:Uncharacterized protein n=1 Tax=Clathrus columnatus TaxID=1419009 RepID=A0AAV5A603_9AGAM|nr:hypothetical protein Clacol_001531 [Clathrus columnatus]
MTVLQTLTWILLLVSATHGEAFQYSSGWSPGQKTTQVTPQVVPTFSPSPSQSESGKFSWSSLFTSGPIGSILSRSGINVTEKLAEAQEKSKLPWDDKIPMITDNNYEELIFNEKFATQKEEEDRVWFIIVSAARNQRTSVSVLVDEEFNKAYNMSVTEGDLPFVRWGRIDYLNVTRLTTKWAVWKAPLYIIAKDRGKTLRFLNPQALGGKAVTVREFLLDGTYLRLYPWVGVWAPGGRYEHILHNFAVFQEFIYLYLSKIPSWLLMMLSGAFGSVILHIFHRPSTPPPPRPAPKPIEASEPEVKPAEPEPSTPKSGKGSVSKRKKKN